ncbi:MAG TPA: hypothetical protein VG796_12250 [Verrucomicrobiales bacterium]|nr:hypothetical protein [Verrucomicrobiales bacterium]
MAKERGGTAPLQRRCRELTGVSAVVDGADAASFTVAGPPVDTIPAGATADWTVTFAPATPGNKTAALHFAGNGVNNIFEVTLAGKALSSLEVWKEFYFESSVNEGISANNADPDQDGLENLLEFAFGLDPAVPDASLQPKWSFKGDDVVLSFTTPENVSGITYAVEYNTSLSAAGWAGIPNSATLPERVYHAPAAGARRLFLRLRVTVP